MALQLRKMIEHPPAFSNLPMWRKVVIVCAFAVFFFIFIASVDRQFTIYGSAPDHPMPATGQVYPVDVMHGYIRYVTLQEKESSLLGAAGSWAGAAFVAAFFIWITGPRRSDRKSVQPFSHRNG